MHDTGDKKPFFARLLEEQELDRESRDVNGPHNKTLKYPSDNDEWPT